MEASKASRHRVSISGMLKYLGVSRSGYRAFLRCKPSAMQKRRARVEKEIQQIYDDSKQNYGSPKITYKLHDKGEIISQRTVAKYMRGMGIRAQWVKHWIAPTKDSDFSKELHNVLNEQFNPDRPNAVWCTDITYIWTYESGYIYLTSIMDLYSRKIVAWTLTTSMEVSCVVDAVNKAKACRPTIQPLLIHSDRGSQYVSAAYRKATEGMQRSYSHKGYPYDNACIESFHSLIKREWLNRFDIANFDAARALVWEYIETFYNTIRIHSHCGYMSPDQFERQYKRMQKEVNMKNVKALAS